MRRNASCCLQELHSINMKKNETQKEPQEDFLSSALNEFKADISGLDSSYRDLNDRIRELDIELSNQNQRLEESLFEVNRLRLFLDSILNSMSDGVVVIDTSGDIVLFNEGIEHLTGYSREEVHGKRYDAVFGRHVSKRFSPIYTLETGVSLNREEKSVRTKAGQTIPVQYSTARVMTNNNQVLGVVEVISDLTRIKRLEKAMQQIKTQTALNQMAKLVAHEIRTPLGGIRGYVDLLSESLNKDEKTQSMLSQIILSVNRLNDTITKFQQFAKPVNPQFETIEIIPFIRELVEFFEQSETLADQKIRVSTAFPAEWTGLKVRVDPILFEQSLLAIMDNAVKAMPSGGSLRIELQQQMNLFGKKNGYLSVHVSDTGIGMSREIQEQMFTPFFTTREIGMGLSLAVVRNFVTMHHGEVSVESAENKGTTVTITIPMNE